LAAQIEQTTTLLESIGTKPTTAVVDLGYRGVDDDVPTVNVIHRGKAKRLTARQKTWLKRRQAVEPTIGHLKADHRMDRCWLKGSEGDALHAVRCAAGVNIRWLMRAIAAQAAKAAQARLFVFLWLRLWAQMALGERSAAIRRAEGHPDQTTRRVGTPTLAGHQFAIGAAG
ncbi:MAG: transposase, partial [bacterium]